MQSQTSAAAWQPVGQPLWLRDLGLAFAISIFVYATYAVSGFPTLSAPGGDNDSMLRLVEVRDLLNGQGWYDLHQYRIGPDGGLLMHWSRLIDAPLAGLILIASALGAGPPLAEDIALTLWPLFLMGITLFTLVRLARALDGDAAVFPAATLGAAALYFVGIYRPGSIDHHNAQVALTVGMLLLMVTAPERPYFSALAGVCAALMLAIGMEAAPYVAVAGLAMALAFLTGSHREARLAKLFGVGFAGTSLTAFVATVGPPSWTVPACDALSNVQLSLAILGGLGLAAIAAIPRFSASFGRRAFALALLGMAVAAVVFFGFPQCLGDPYAAVDPRLRAVWLDFVSEAQSIIQLAASDWTKLLVYYVTPALGLGTISLLIWREGVNRSRLIYGGFLLAAFAVSCWQVRGSSFAVPLATTALAIGIARVRVRAQNQPSTANSLILVAAWIVSVNIVWSTLGSSLSAREKPAEGAVQQDCTADASYAALAGLPPSMVLAVSDLGSAILANTGHRVLAAPYHRNIAGNLAVVDAMMGLPEQARSIVAAHGVDYVTLCLGNAETRNFRNLAPAGLMAVLVAGKPPEWLKLDPATADAAIRIYRVDDPR